MKRILLSLAIIIEALTASAQNVVNLGRYSGANASQPERCSVVLIGDSITDFWPNNRPDTFSPEGIVGRGISGEVSAQMLLRFRQDVLALRPRVVVINAGTNDIALNLGEYNEDYTFGNLVSMAEIAAVNGIIPVLTTILPAGSFPWRPEVTDSMDKIRSLNECLAAFAADNKIPFVNYFDALLSPDGTRLDPAFSGDGVHPNADGYKVMESVLLPVLDTLLQ